MEDKRKAWAAFIKKLMMKHNLSLRGMVSRTDELVSRQAIMRWLSGSIPTYHTAIDLLKNFSREEAIEGLEIAGYPIPDDWKEENLYKPDQVVVKLRKSGRISEETIKQVEEILSEVKNNHTEN
ncbi:MAG: hypothetical protein ACYC27_02905 [Armatimonadota bacterium]